MEKELTWRCFFHRFLQAIERTPCRLFFGQLNLMQYAFEARCMEIPPLSVPSPRFNETLTNGQRPFGNIEIGILICSLSSSFLFFLFFVLT